MTTVSAPQPLLRTLVYPSTQQPVYQELQLDRFSPSSHPIGVCFSGGGPRAMTCGMGQIRGLMQTPLYDLIGSISCVSGGSWFGAIFSFADPSIYNQRIARWVSQLQPDVAAFLDNKDKTELMANFPNYDTVQQNSDRLGIKELLLYTPRQVNLLADMWTWAILDIAGDLRRLV